MKAFINVNREIQHIGRHQRVGSQSNVSRIKNSFLFLRCVAESELKKTEFKVVLVSSELYNLVFVREIYFSSSVFSLKTFI